MDPGQEHLVIFNLCHPQLKIMRLILIMIMILDLKNSYDAYASAANYLKNMGWNINSPCFYKIELNEKFKKIFECFSKKILNKKN